MAGTRTSSAQELLLTLDRDGPLPLHRALEEALRQAVRSGRLAPAAVLPSTRALAQELGVSRGLVVEAYEQLIAEGYLTSRPGGATRVARAAAPSTAAPTAPVRPIGIEFRSGRPDLSQFPREAWLRAFRRVLTEAPNERLGYLDGRGIPELQVALAEYLNRVRGTATTSEHVVICAGFAQGLRLVTQVVRAAGGRRIAMEDPGHPDSRAIAESSGLEVVGVPVDGAGMLVDRLSATRADAVLVTAAHQYPTGGVLPPERRAALIRWATQRGALIIEDDYDAEYRYDREPIGAMHGLSPDHVVYAGSASKVLAPGLRLGWLLVPGRLVDAVARAKSAADLGSPALEQLAFADFVARGDLDRHLRRMRPMYRRRRDAMLAALERHLPDLRPTGAAAGLHVLAWLPDGLDEAAIVRAAGESGIAIEDLAAQRIEPAGTGGLLFGYGSIQESDVDRSVRRLAEVIAGVAAPPVGHTASTAGRDTPRDTL